MSISKPTDQKRAKQKFLQECLIHFGPKQPFSYKHKAKD
jgi:hypothetical protein